MGGVVVYQTENVNVKPSSPAPIVPPISARSSAVATVTTEAEGNIPHLTHSSAFKLFFLGVTVRRDGYGRSAIFRWCEVSRAPPPVLPFSEFPDCVSQVPDCSGQGDRIAGECLCDPGSRLDPKRL